MNIEKRIDELKTKVKSMREFNSKGDLRRRQLFSIIDDCLLKSEYDELKEQAMNLSTENKIDLIRCLSHDISLKLGVIKQEQK